MAWILGSMTSRRVSPTRLKERTAMKMTRWSWTPAALLVVCVGCGRVQPAPEAGGEDPASGAAAEKNADASENGKVPDAEEVPETEAATETKTADAGKLPEIRYYAIAST